MADVITYHIDINATAEPGEPSYMAELQTMELSDELRELNNEELYELLTDWDNPDGRDALENGSLGVGPFVDQKAVVFTESGQDTNVVAVIDIEEALDHDLVHDSKHHLPYSAKGKHAIAVHVDKGGFTGQFEMPSDVDFDPALLTFGVVALADTWSIINTVQYNGQMVFMDVDSSGKGSDYYTFEDDAVTSIA